MKKKKSTNRTFNTYIPQEHLDAITERAETLLTTPSKVGSTIIANWYNSGCPAVTELDEALHLVRKAKAEKKTVAEVA